MSAPATVEEEAAAAPAERDQLVDFLRAGSLFVVVLWHWVFTVVVWEADGPHATNPIATTRALWAATWLLQVMPLFFFVGGYSNQVAWRRTVARGGGYREFVGRRLGRLGGPTAVCVALALAAWGLARIVFPDVGWSGRGIALLLSPLWFLIVYVLLVAIVPPSQWLHDRAGEVVLVVAVGGAAWVDLARFHFDVPAIAWVNMVFVWGVVHQFGYFYDRLRRGGPRVGWSLLLAGLGGLTVLTNMGLYPRSMVGVPGERFSNMGPPTLCIVALAALQVGALIVFDRPLRAWLERPVAQRLIAFGGRYAMTTFLWHLTGFAIAYAVLVGAGIDVPEQTSGAWWAQRPLFLVLPALATAPLIALFSRFERTPRRAAPVAGLDG